MVAWVPMTIISVDDNDDNDDDDDQVAEDEDEDDDVVAESADDNNDLGQGVTIDTRYRTPEVQRRHCSPDLQQYTDLHRAPR